MRMSDSTKAAHPRHVTWDTIVVLDEMEAEAKELLAAGEYDHALAEFSVLREIRSRREGPYSVKYLANVHDCVRCMRHLNLWGDADPLCRELHGKYVRTHGRGQSDTVDVAKHWAWAMVHLNNFDPAVRLYLITADAIWDTDPDAARKLVGAAMVHAEGTSPADHVAPGRIDGVPLIHGGDIATAIEELIVGSSTTASFDGADLPAAPGRATSAKSG